jgi:hypothetical protein
LSSAFLAYCGGRIFDWGEGLLLKLPPESPGMVNTTVEKEKGLYHGFDTAPS